MRFDVAVSGVRAPIEGSADHPNFTFYLRHRSRSVEVWCVAENAMLCWFIFVAVRKSVAWNRICDQSLRSSRQKNFICFVASIWNGIAPVVIQEKEAFCVMVCRVLVHA